MIRSVRRVPLRVAECSLYCTVLLAPCHAAGAQSAIDARQTLNDAKLYVTAPLRWDSNDWTVFGGAVALVAASHEFDTKVRDHFAGSAPIVLDGKDRNSSRDAYPAAAIVAATWLYASVIDDSSGYVEGWQMLEAAGLSTLSVYALKLAAGRDRPNESTSPDHWFGGGSSFPSLHTSAAFAIGTVLAESGNENWRWLRRGLGYGVALGTAYRRLDGNAHWMSDTVAGAAIGLATAGFVLERPSDRWLLHGLNVQPLERGAMVSWSMPLD